MIQYREILRLHSQGVSQRGIAAACRCSRKTIRDLVERAKNHGIEWPFEKNTTDSDLQELLFPEKATVQTGNCRIATTSTGKWAKAA